MTRQNEEYLLDAQSTLSDPSTFGPPSRPANPREQKKNKAKKQPKAYRAPVIEIKPQAEQGRKQHSSRNNDYDRRSNKSKNSRNKRSTRNDNIDQMVSRVDQQDDDKYRTPILQESVTGDAWSSQEEPESDEDSQSMYTTDIENRGTHSMASISSAEIEQSSPRRRQAQDINDLYQILEEQDYYKTKQKFAYLSIVISAFQLLVLALQLSLCGVAPLDVNPFVGTYPDALSQWGGKNPYLTKEGEWWRLVTPAFLNVGVLQLLVNAVVQLETCAFFEREWGWMRYLWIYLMSAVGCSIVSCAANPDSVGVGSSGALMGLFGAKLAQVMTQVCFDFSKKEEDSIRLEQLSSVLCSLSVVLGLSFFTYIDWSGHMGGLGTGFLVGMIAFSQPIRSKVSRTIWRLLGIVLLLTGMPAAFYIFIEIIEPDADLGDTCEYFRNLYAEGYDCSCFVF